MSRMTVRFDRVFTKKGNFNLSEFGLSHFDPYRKSDDENYLELYNLLFNEDGSLIYEAANELEIYIQVKKFPAICDAVKLYYAQKHGSKTNGSYPAVYMFK